jgi:hypothetical protein
MKYLFKRSLRKLGYKIVRYESIPYNRRFLEIYEVFKDLNSILEKNSVEGLFVECGFGYGRSFSVLSHFAVKGKRNIYGFDSFTGFPNVLGIDDSNRNPKNGEWAVRTLSEANNFIKSLGVFNTKSDYHLSQVVFDKKTKNPIPNQAIALLHIDLDLYEGYKYALEIFWDQIAIGGIILFDEYNLVQWPGATAAINEFLLEKDLNIDYIKQLNGKHYIVKS